MSIFLSGGHITPRQRGRSDRRVQEGNSARYFLMACLLLACLAVTATSCGAAVSARSGGVAPGQSTAPGGHLRTLAAEYLAIAVPANRRLDAEVDAYRKNARHNLAAAEAALLAEAATERQFDRSLLVISFPPSTAAVARALVRVNQQRIGLTERQARARSIAALATYAGDHRAADAAVEVQVRIIRADLGLPPPDNS